MRIMQISYRANRPKPGNQYNHEHVEATVAVAEGESAEEGLQMAKDFVNTSLSVPSTINVKMLTDLVRQSDSDPRLALKAYCERYKIELPSSLADKILFDAENEL